MEHGLEIRSTLTSSGTLELSLEEVTTPELRPDEVLLRVEASPINPSDLGLLLGPADPHSFEPVPGSARPALRASIPTERLAGLTARLDRSMPVGNEGAGVVIDAGSEARALLGRTVATRTAGMYAQYRVAKSSDCLPLPAGASARDGASAFVNPLSALGMTETMRREGHTALVHTAAASNLGQMLNRICIADGIPLVNIVRSAAHVELLKKNGASYVIDSSAPDFRDQLIAALVATKATLAFDATGGGTLASTILSSMEAAAARELTAYSRYGSTVHKQVYIYGGLDTSSTTLGRDFGMAWGIGGWLVMTFMAKLDPATARRLTERVASELTTTFASSYSAEISLTEALDPQIVAAYSKRSTGEKYLIVPTKHA